ncbi:hypothetical protein [Micromonospora sp. NPDC005806]|uniref:hypothetical protein n=1 Tax=Micromonospora sp. NPDC005806 TaxID=3364234 RepID=UPI00369D7845
MTGPSDASVTSAVERIARAWSRRSAAERADFTHRLLPAEAPLAPPWQARQRVRQRAALSGAVAPQLLVADFADEQAEHLLAVLAPEFDRTYDGSAWSWTLRSAPRQETLVRLAAGGAIMTALSDADNIPTDPAGESLRELVRHGPAASRAVSPDVAVQALAWAVSLGGFAGHLAEARRQARIRAISASYGVLLQRGFFGREAVMAQLRAFAEAPVDPAADLPLLAVTGIGGAGKSTVLAALIRPYLDGMTVADPTVPAVVVIDFDRMQFRIDAQLELSFEVTRQLGAAHPVAGADFSALRHQAREVLRGTGGNVWAGPNSVESDSRGSQGFEHDAGILVRLHGLQSRPVLLVLDTFEEWQRERPYHDAPREDWNDPERRILGWIDRIRRQMDLGGLRVIVSGRAEVAPAAGLGHPLTEHLGDLPPAAACELLGALGLTAGHAHALADIVGGNPLTLRVAARFFERLDPSERNAFIAGGAEATANLDSDLRRAVLYDRFLGHIGDPRVRQLAHPGLVLRRVTPALVRDVLAPQCDLGPLTVADAEALTRRLADEVWLVKQMPDGLRHQPDVRRAMLRMMVTDTEQTVRTRAIHEAAARWYEQGRDDLSPAEAAVEALYHRLMMRDRDTEIDEARVDAEWRRQALALGESVAELPPRLAAQVRVLRGDDITEDDAATLPDAMWARWVVRRGAALVEAGDAPRALALLDDRELATEPEWLAQAYCEAARWSEYWSTADRRFATSARGRDRERPRTTRYAVVDAVASRVDTDVTTCLRWQADYLDGISGQRPPVDEAVEQLFYSLLLQRPASGPWRYRRLAADLTARQARDSRKREDRFPVDQLRRALTWMAAGAQGPPLTLGHLAGLYRPDPSWERDFARLTGRPAPVPRSIGDLRTDEILGDLALRFGREFDGARLATDRLREYPRVVGVLRGDNPELRPAIRLALAELLGEDQALVRLARIAEQLLPVPTADLTPAAMPADEAPEARAVLTRLVEYVDRSGVMGPFLDVARAAWPAGRRLRRTQRAFVRWDLAYAGVLDAVADELRAGRRAPSGPDLTLSVLPHRGDPQPLANELLTRLRRHIALAGLTTTPGAAGEVVVARPTSTAGRVALTDILMVTLRNVGVRGIVVRSERHEVGLGAGPTTLASGIRQLAELLSEAAAPA